jgi:ribosomal-protein-alanine N-acetyltransferase
MVVTPGVSPTEVLESKRLVFRPQQMSDLESFCAMEQDVEVRRYVGGAPRTREDAEKRFKAGKNHWEDLLGLRAVILKSDGVYIGRAGLYPHFGPQGPVAGEASISYYLAREYWGQGFATEAGAFFVKRGFGVLGLSRIVTTIDARHEASRRVLEKLGFQLYETEAGSRVFQKYELLHGHGPLV